MRLAVKVRQLRRARVRCRDSPFSRRTQSELVGELLRLRGRQGAVAREDGEVDIKRAATARVRRTRRPGRRSREPSRCACAFRRAPPAGRRAQVEKLAAADRALSRRVADDEAIAAAAAAIGRSSTSWTSAAAPGSDRLVAEQDDARADLGGGVMQPHRKPLAGRLRLSRQKPQSRVDAVGRGVQCGVEHDVAAR